MPLDIVGAGFGRTGTHSLKLALERLGFSKCYHMFEVVQHPEHIALWQRAHAGEALDWHALFEGYRASVDWPSCNFWREQCAAFPDAKVILSTREPHGWYRSVMNTIWPSSRAALEAPEPERRAFGRFAKTVIWDAVFDGRMDDEDHVVEVFRAHEARVRAEVPADRLLVFDAAEGWAPLCAFLGVPVPGTDYPRSNTTEDFRAAMAATASPS